MGAVIGAVIWGFMRVMHLCIDFLWEILPAFLGIPYYPLLICLIGGVLIGLLQKYYGSCPDELEEVMAEVKTTGTYHYQQVPMMLLAALLPLIFGGSVGPEAGLTGVIVGLCCWAGDRFRFAHRALAQLKEIGVSSTLSIIFGSPLFGFVWPIERELEGQETLVLPKRQKLLQNIFAIFGGLLICILLSRIFGGGTGLPRFDEAFQVGKRELLFFVPLLVFGVLFGLEFKALDRLTARLAAPFREKRFLCAVGSGLILGIMGMVLPLSLFSGEAEMAELIAAPEAYSASLLFITAAVKIVLIHLCLKFGWRGGNFFPAIFCGVCVGYACAAVFPCNAVFCCSVVTAALMSTIMRMPVAVAMLLMLCFPADGFLWILGTSFLVSLLPDFFGDGKRDAKRAAMRQKLKDKRAARGSAAGAREETSPRA